MLDRYFKINDKIILAGQYPSTGEWYCKELPAQSSKELDALIGDVNSILNKYNNVSTDKKKQENSL